MDIMRNQSLFSATVARKHTNISTVGKYNVRCSARSCFQFKPYCVFVLKQGERSRL